MSDLPWARARERARAAAPAAPVLTTALAEALGCTAASDLVALGPVPHAATSAMDAKIAQLRELAALRDQGVLTDAELAEQKARILGR